MTQTLDPFDELAAMFMTDAGRPAAPASSTATEIELLIVGHLPVRAGLWLTPYADAVAREQGPVVLVRLDGDDAMLQIVRGDPALVAPASCRNLREAILTLGPAAPRWILRPSAQAAPETLAQAGADRITILSSADQAAIVNAYRVVKDLVEPRDGAPRKNLDLGLAVVGVETVEAEAVATRLAGTIRECLGVEMPLVLSLPRMDAAMQASHLRSFPGQGRPDLGEVVTWIREAARRQAPAVTVPTRPSMPGMPKVVKMIPTSASPPASDLPLPAPSAMPPPLPSAVPPAAARPDAVPPLPAPPVPVPAPVHAPAPLGVSAADPFEGIVRRQTMSFAAATVEEKHTAAPREPDVAGAPVVLATYVDGLTPIAPRCPGHERVELALDAAGIVHMLSREESLRELGVVDRWVRAHQELLDLACPNQTVTPGAAPRRHVFTSAPLNVADLHGGDAQLHVLAPVTVDGRVGWYAAPLSRDA